MRALPRDITGTPGLEDLRRRIDALLGDFVETKAAEAADRGLPVQPARILREFLLAGGKRIRPLLSVLGWQAATGAAAPTEPALRVAAAVEMFHAFCLIHDDIIDNSATRRGRPTVHRTLSEHSGRFDAPRAEHLGVARALLVGDLALAWSDELIHGANLTDDRLTSVHALIDAMRTEVMYGQYLDVSATGAPGAGLEQALAIIRYKTAKYSVERPLHLGATLADAPAALMRQLSAYALPLGEAFQLRDDLLGVFGDPATTGKSRLEDLREGKPTVLLALALREASPHHAEILRRLVGDPRLTESEAARVRDILTATGARERVEEMIEIRYRQARQALQSLDIPVPVHTHLRRLARRAVRRSA